MSEEEKLQLENECLLKYSKAQMIQKYIDELEENCTLSDLWCKSQEENKQLKSQLQQKENIMKEVREYITSYESIETIQQCEHSENNKGLDRDTMIEMTNRYLKVHDKILEILDKEVN